MAVDKLPEVLTWKSGLEMLNERHNWYVMLLSDYFGQALRKIRRVDEIQFNQISQGLGALSSEGFLRLLTAPEVAFRVLSQQDRKLLDTSQFVHDAVLAENLREGHKILVRRPTWTALGDMCFMPDGSIKAFGQAGGVLLDFGSPHLAKLDIHGEERTTDGGHLGHYDSDAIPSIAAQLEHGMEGIKVSSELVYSFVSTFIKVIMLAEVPDQSHFMSGSNSAWPGRVMFFNVDASRITIEQLADALVHEAIHGLLTMEALSTNWASDERIFSAGNVASPWTGKTLPLGAFLQACFVWYGLVNFWSIATGRNGFDKEQAYRNLQFATNGFLRGRLVALLSQDWKGELSSELLTAIDEIQSRVVASAEQFGQGLIQQRESMTPS